MKIFIKVEEINDWKKTYKTLYIFRNKQSIKKHAISSRILTVSNHDAASASTKKTRHPSRAGVANLSSWRAFRTFFWIRDVAGELENNGFVSFLNFYAPRFSKGRGESRYDRTRVSNRISFIYIIDPLPRLDPVRIVDRLRNTRVERACYTR